MEFLINVFKVIALIVTVFLWNKFIVRNLIGLIVRFHKDYNTKNIDRQPIKFIIEKERKICQVAYGINWLGATIVSLGILST